MAFETETWWYAGRRELKSKLVHAFTSLQDEGFLLYSKAPKSPVIGASYRVEVNSCCRPPSTPFFAGSGAIGTALGPTGTKP